MRWGIVLLITRHPVAFMSKMFMDTERKYKIYDRELLGIIQALKKWRHYIQGSGHTTVIFSDCKNLTYFRTAQKLNDRQARWLLYLSEFDIKLIHLPGSKMIQSNALSWQPNHGIEGQLEEEEVIMLPENMFINLLDTNLQERILNVLRTLFLLWHMFTMPFSSLFHLRLTGIYHKVNIVTQ